MRRFLPVLLGLMGLIAGGGAGYVLRPAGVESAAAEVPAEGVPADTGIDAAAPPDHGDAAAVPPGDAGHAGADADHAGQLDYVKLNNQFVVPVIRDDRVAALVILSLTLEVAAGAGERVFAAEPKLRDSFLQVLFDHANAGGFDGAYTESTRMRDLRKALVEPARALLGDVLGDVLITDIVRQDT